MVSLNHLTKVLHVCLVKSSSHFPDDKYLYHELINCLHTEPICYISQVECCIWLTHVIMEPVSRISFVEVANIVQGFYHRVTSQGANRAIFLQATREGVLNYLQAHVWEVIWNNMGGIVACMMLWFHKNPCYTKLQDAMFPLKFKTYI